MPPKNNPQQTVITTTPNTDPLALAAKRIADLEAQVKAQEEANAALVKARTSLTVSVGPSGAVSVYGLGRFPMTAYAEQWERILAFADSPGGLKAYIAEGRKLGAFARKGTDFVQPNGLPLKFVAKAKRAG